MKFDINLEIKFWKETVWLFKWKHFNRPKSHAVSTGYQKCNKNVFQLNIRISNFNTFVYSNTNLTKNCNSIKRKELSKTFQ
jgi:hypothetical protein